MFKYILRCLLAIIILLNVSCLRKDEEQNITTTQLKVEFCELFNNSEHYVSKDVQTRAIIVGFHEFILYSKDCFDEYHTLSLEFDKTSRQQLIELVNNLNEKGFYRNNIYGKIVITGQFKENNYNEDNSEQELFKQKFAYKILVTEVKEFSPLEEKILPGDYTP